MELGTKVKSLRAFSGVSVGTIGYALRDGFDKETELEFLEIVEE